MSAAERMSESTLQQGIALLNEKYSAFEITSPAQLVESVEVNKAIKRQRDAVVEFFRDSKQKAHAAWKAIVAQEKSFTDAIDEVELKIKTAIRTYEAKQERLRREEEKRLREIADAEARKAQETLLAQAQEAQAVGNTTAADAILDFAAQITTASIHITTAAPKTQGVSFRSSWEIGSIDKQALIRAAASDPNLAAFLIIDESALKRAANAVKGQISIPGVTFQEEKTVNIRK